eukprot:TRINITY_DN93781_c0_g1_i1.p1 TRINITY_DN93781_c0_g1~~TRINITY_DN93781_c0_g1_i1.p1  ORF type:complete len:336 (+),score=58.25 TRINITY_DN93781_c0_g1_i1:25-1008(+)
MSGLFSRNSLEHAVAGSAGTILATILVFPLERLKTLLQIESGETRVVDVVRRILQEEGTDGFYRGCFPMLQTVGASNFLYFYLFEGLKEPLAVAAGRAEGVISPYEALGASALAGALNMVVTEPLWRACIVAQAASKNAALVEGRHSGGGTTSTNRLTKGVFLTVYQMWLKEGPRALWRGLGTSLWLVSNPVIQFFAYDWLKAMRTKGADVSSIEAFVMGAVAKALATVFTFPLQVAQSRLRIAAGSDQSDRPDLQGMVPCLKALYREKGLGGMYFGLGPKLMQTVTQAALMFAFYEKVHWIIRRASRRGMKRLAAYIQKKRLSNGV